VRHRGEKFALVFGSRFKRIHSSVQGFQEMGNKHIEYYKYKRDNSEHNQKQRRHVIFVVINAVRHYRQRIPFQSGKRADGNFSLRRIKGVHLPGMQIFDNGKNIVRATKQTLNLLFADYKIDIFRSRNFSRRIKQIKGYSVAVSFI
jgi:hypothetical protein